MMGTSIAEGFTGKGYVWTLSPPGDLQGVFDGFTNILFTVSRSAFCQSAIMPIYSGALA